MAFLHKFGIKNFRIFENQTDFEFAPITVLTGTNSSGKSSLIKALLLLQQSFKNKTEKINLGDKKDTAIHTFPEIDELDFTTAKHKLASFDNVLTNKGNADYISFMLPLTLGYGEASYAVLNYKSNDRPSSNNGRLDSVVAYTSEKEIKLFEFIRKDENGWEINVNYSYFRKKTDEIVNNSFSGNKESSNEIELIEERWHELRSKDENNLTKEEKKELDELDETIDDHENKKLNLDYYDQFSAGNINIIEDNLANTYDKIIGIKADEYLPNTTFYDLPFLIDSFNKEKIIKQIDKNKLERWIGLVKEENIGFKAEASPDNVYSFIQKKLQQASQAIKEELKKRDYYFETEKEFMNALIEGESEFIQDKLNNKRLDFKALESAFFENYASNPKHLVAFLFTNSLNTGFYKMHKKNPKTSDLYRGKQSNKDLFIETITLYSQQIQKDKELQLCNSFLYTLIENTEGIIISHKSYDRFISELHDKRIPAAFHNSLNFLESIHYVEGVRASNERVYAYKSQGTGINELLPQFESLHLEQNSPEILFLNEWVKKFNVGDEVEVLHHPEGIGTQIKIDNKSLADVGFGVSQFLPILLNIILVANKNKSGYPFSWRTPLEFSGYHSNTMIIEEPETNLHPRLQSQLAELIVDAAKKFHIQFILETHSEYLIRKLQYLTAKKDDKYHIKPEHSVIYYFNDPKKMDGEKEHVRKIRIKDNGILDGSFGPGFMDEASNLIKDIYQLSTSN